LKLKIIKTNSIKQQAKNIEAIPDLFAHVGDFSLITFFFNLGRLGRDLLDKLALGERYEHEQIQAAIWSPLCHH